jgi:Heparinase II/III-like protein
VARGVLELPDTSRPGAVEASRPGAGSVRPPAGAVKPHDERVHDDIMHVSLAVAGCRILVDTGALLPEDARAAYFDSPWAHNTLVVRDATPMQHYERGCVRSLDGDRVYVDLGARAWLRSGEVLWHRRELLYDPRHEAFSICDRVEGATAPADIEVYFHVPTDLEIVVRGDLGCIFWKRFGLFRLHPFFAQPLRGVVEKGRDNAPPLAAGADASSCLPLQRVRYAGTIQAPAQMVFWMSWNVAGAATPLYEEAVGAFERVRGAGSQDA